MFFAHVINFLNNSTIDVKFATPFITDMFEKLVSFDAATKMSDIFSIGGIQSLKIQQRMSA